MNTARYRNAVYSALWVQAALVVCYLPLIKAIALLNTSKRDAFILLPCLAIYKYFSIYKLITEPLYLLLEDQRSEISCKRNIKATRPLMERLVYHGLLCMLFSYKFIPNQNLLYGKILPEKKSAVLVESSFIQANIAIHNHILQ